MSASASVFEQHRSRLLRLAHRMLGSRGDAEDVVQDAYLRWHQAEADAIRTPEAWLVTVVTRLALDRLRAANSDRAAYVGPWLPEPWLHGASGVEAPDAPSERGDDLAYAVLVLLERLTPEERAAFLLRDVFSVDYSVVADALSKSEAACRQLVHRARERLAEGRARHAATASDKLDLLRRFQAAVSMQDETALGRLFAPDAAFVADGGGKVLAARRVLHGSAHIVRALLGVARKYTGAIVETVVLVEGEPALVASHDGGPIHVTFIDADDQGIRAVYRMLNPDKLRRIWPRAA